MVTLPAAGGGVAIARPATYPRLPQPRRFVSVLFLHGGAGAAKLAAFRGFAALGFGETARPACLASPKA
jgi:hypothetical protein